MVEIEEEEQHKTLISMESDSIEPIIHSGVNKISYRGIVNTKIFL